VWWGVVALAVVGLWLTVAHRHGSPLTEAEARRHLDRIVAAARAGDLDAMCSLNGSPFNCRRTLEGTRDRVPPDPPDAVAARYVGKSATNDTPGWLLVVEGTRAAGGRYRTEVFVFRDDEGRVKAINAVYWSGATLDLGAG
jgi:hypothetical protein